MKTTRTITLIYVAALAFIFTACTNNSATQHQQGRPTITVSIPPLQWFAEAIAGDSLQVNTLLAQSADPETFEPGVGTMKRLSDSRAFITTGVFPFEQALADNIHANNRQLIVRTIADSIPLIYGTHSHNHDAHHGQHNHAPCHGNEMLEADPHIWLSVNNAHIIAHNMFRAIIEADPNNKEYYQHRYQMLNAMLDSLQTTIADKLEPFKGRAFAIWHPSLSYFARDYDLKQIAFNAENKETSTVRLGNTLQNAKQQSPLAFFIPASLSRQQTDNIASNLGIAPTVFNQMNAEWPAEITAIADAIATE